MPIHVMVKALQAFTLTKHVDMSPVKMDLTCFINATYFNRLKFRLFVQVVSKILSKLAQQNQTDQNEKRTFSSPASASTSGLLLGHGLASPALRVPVRRRQAESALMHSLYDCFALPARWYVCAAALV